MRILKNIRNGRFFVANKALLKSKNMVPATPEEEKAFLSTIKPEAKKKYEAMQEKQAVALALPDDLDPTINISSMGKPDLIVICNKIGLSVPQRMRVKEIRELLQEKLNELAASEPEGETEGEPEPDAD